MLQFLLNSRKSDQKYIYYFPSIILLVVFKVWGSWLILLLFNTFRVLSFYIKLGKYDRVLQRKKKAIKKYVYMLESDVVALLDASCSWTLYYCWTRVVLIHMNMGCEYRAHTGHGDSIMLFDRYCSSWYGHESNGIERSAGIGIVLTDMGMSRMG
jgi:hypothetical protein